MRAWMAIAVLVLSACAGGNCATDSDCTMRGGPWSGAAQGWCMQAPASADTWCAYPDETCYGSGRRWDHSAGDGLACYCVSAPSDGGHDR